MPACIMNTTIFVKSNWNKMEIATALKKKKKKKISQQEKNMSSFLLEWTFENLKKVQFLCRKVEKLFLKVVENIQIRNH